MYWNFKIMNVFRQKGISHLVLFTVHTYYSHYANSSCLKSSMLICAHCCIFYNFKHKSHSCWENCCRIKFSSVWLITTQQFCSNWQFQCFSSDGRVTSSTTKLIQTLLVLDPKKRLTASQVLSVLSETMRKWWVLITFSKPVLPKTTSTRKYFSFIRGLLLLEK